MGQPFDIVMQHNVHGPCGLGVPSAQCMNEDGQCTKEFLKAFSVTMVVESGRYTDNRRRNGIKYGSGIHNLNNQWVVPSNPYLSKKYNCPINVEACMSVNEVNLLPLIM